VHGGDIGRGSADGDHQPRESRKDAEGRRGAIQIYFALYIYRYVVENISIYLYMYMHVYKIIYVCVPTYTHTHTHTHIAI